MSREIAISNGLGAIFNFVGIRFFRPTNDLPFQHAQDEPSNLGAQLNAVPFSYLANQSPYYEAEETPHAREEWLQGIDRHFHEPWLPAYLLRCRMDATSYAAAGYSYSALSIPISPDMYQQRLQKGLPTLRTIETGMKAEPKNVFWVVARAWWEWNYAPRPFYPAPKSNFAMMPPTEPEAMSPPGAPGVPFPAPPAMVAPLPDDSDSDPVPIPVSPPSVPYVPYVGMVPSTEFLALPGMVYAVPLPGPHPSISLVPNNEPVVLKTLEILRRAHACTYYDDGSAQADSLMRSDRLSGNGTYLESDWLREESAPLRETSFLLELPSELWGTTTNNLSSMIRVPYAPAAPLEPLGARLTPQILVASGAAIARVGNLIDALPQKAHERVRRPAYAWLDTGWNLDTAPVMSRRRPPAGAASARFASYARAIGEKEYARQALAIEAQVSARDALWRRVATRSLLRYFRELREADALVPPFSVWSAALCGALSVCLMCLAPLWMFLNILLVGSVGTPSSRPQRWGMSLALITGLLLLSLWSMAYISMSITRFIGYGVPAIVIGAATMAFVLFSALICLVVTIGRHHPELVNPNPDKWHTRLLSPLLRPWVEPTLLGASTLLLFSVGVWLFWLLFNPTRSFRPILGKISVSDLVQALGIYALGSGVLAFIIWLVNWRWPHKQVRPITHSGLRWWKECIGASICILAWMYLFIALAAWPARTEAKRMIAERWQMGDWTWLQKNL